MNKDGIKQLDARLEDMKNIITSLVEVGPLQQVILCFIDEFSTLVHAIDNEQDDIHNRLKTLEAKHDSIAQTFKKFY